MARPCQRCQHANEDHAKFCLSCGAMLEVDVVDAGDPLIGKVLMGRYRPIRLLGEGGMGRVYVAEQKMGAAVRKVAIKTLHPELSQDPQLVARFHRESETVIELSHPNTIQFYDFGEMEDGTLFIVMEFIEGRSLASLMEQGRLDVARIDKILIQVCGSLQEAHGRGIVHRDLKPDNILLTDRGGQTDFVKVLDFGIAKKDEADDPQKQKLTKQGMVLGTPPYMSPEQFSGRGLDARSDIYSLGVMAYEMLTGVLPFEAKTPWEWATKHLTTPPAPLDAHPIGASLPAHKKNAVMRALLKDREQRQAHVLGFLHEFTGHQDAQAAWTMATSSGGGPAVGLSPAPVGPATPASSAFRATGPGLAPTQGLPSAHGAQDVGRVPPGSAGAPFGQAHSPAPTGGYPGAGYPGTLPSQPGLGPYEPTGPMEPPSSGGGKATWIVAAILGLFVLVGGLGGLFVVYLYLQPDEVPAVTNGPSGPGTIGLPTTPVMQPVTTTSLPLDAGVVAVQGTTTPVTPVPTPAPDAGRAAVVGVDPPVAPAVRPVVRPTPRTQAPSAADEAAARQYVQSGLQAVGRNDFRSAVAALREAQRTVGRRSPVTAALLGEIDRRGGNQVLGLLQQGNCAGAQQLYREFSGVGATGSQRYFDASWCPRP